MEGWTARLISAWKRSGWNKAELARQSGVADHNVYKYLAGGVKQPRGDVLNDLADALRVEGLWLREGIGPEFNSTPVKIAGPKLELLGSDQCMGRGIEDLIVVMMKKKVIRLEDLPGPARKLLDRRQQLRAARVDGDDD